jgi:3-methyladenine DNA glycosylase AlkD
MNKIILKDYHEALILFEKYKNEERAMFHKKVINSKLHFFGLNSKEMDEILETYLLLDGPLDHSYELTSLIFHSNIKTRTNILEFLDDYLNHIDNWAHVDTILTYKEFKKLKFEDVYLFNKNHLSSNKEFVIRFCFISFIVFKREIDKYNLVLELINTYHNLNNYYYVEMAIAWLLSEYFIHNSIDIYNFIESANISLKIKLLTIRKIKESKRTKSEDVIKLEKLKTILKVKK